MPLLLSAPAPSPGSPLMDGRYGADAFSFLTSGTSGSSLPSHASTFAEGGVMPLLLAAGGSLLVLLIMAYAFLAFLWTVGTFLMLASAPLWTFAALVAVKEEGEEVRRREALRCASWPVWWFLLGHLLIPVSPLIMGAFFLTSDEQKERFFASRAGRLLTAVLLLKKGKDPEEELQALTTRVETLRKDLASLRVLQEGRRKENHLLLLTPLQEEDEEEDSWALEDA